MRTRKYKFKFKEKKKKHDSNFSLDTPSVPIAASTSIAASALTAGLSPPGGKAGSAARENISPLPAAPAVAARSAGKAAHKSLKPAYTAACTVAVAEGPQTAHSAAPARSAGETATTTTTSTATTTAPALIDIPETDWANFDWSQHLLKKVRPARTKAKSRPARFFNRSKCPPRHSTICLR